MASKAALKRIEHWHETGLATCVHHGEHDEWTLQRVKHPRGDYTAFKCKKCNRRNSAEYYHRSKTDLAAQFANKLNGARGRANKRGLPCEITVDWLVAKYEEQGGKCAYTGWEFDLTTTGAGVSDTNPRAISIERVDSDRGYVPDNVVLVCHVINVMKKAMTTENFLIACRAVCDHAGV